MQSKNLIRMFYIVETHSTSYTLCSE